MNQQQVKNLAKLLADDLEARGRYLKYNDATTNILRMLPTDITKGDNDIIVAKVASVVRNEVSMYKNEFQAHLQSFIESARKYLTVPPVTSGSFNIVKVTLPELCRHAEELGLFQEPLTIEAYRNTTIDGIKFKEFKLDDLFMGKASIDKHIKDLFVAEDFSMDKMSYYFDLMQVQPKLQDAIYVVDDLIKAWLIANVLRDKYIEDVASTKSNLDNIVWGLETCIYHAMKAHEHYVEKGRLFLKADNDRNVYIVKEVFDRAPDEIGLMDAILGTAVTDVSTLNAMNTSLDGIIAAKEELSKKWIAYTTALTAEDPVRRYRRVRAGYVIAFKETYDNVPVDFRGYNQEHGNYVLLENKVIDYLTGKTLTGSEDEIEDVAIAIVAGILFGSTNYKKFIDIGGRYLDKQPEATVDDILPMVITEIIVDFIFGNVKEVKTK